jgi:NADH dehydrogenase FAD-containing subunit
MTQKHRVVIIGANFGGLSAASELAKAHHVTVIDPSAHFEFLPNIHELVSGVKRATHLRLPRQRLVRRLGARFVRDAVTAIEPQNNRVLTLAGQWIHYDACIVGVGGVNNDFGVSGVAEHALAFKSVDDCAAIGSRLRALSHASSPASVVIVGGGLEGVEALGEILRRYRHNVRLHVHLVDSADRLLSSAPASLAHSIERRCSQFPVAFHYGARVAAVTRHQVVLESGETLPSDATIWTGGARPSPLLIEAGLVGNTRNWAPVDNQLRSLVHDAIFVIGDAAGMEQPMSKQAYHAMEMGKCAARNVSRLLRGARLQSYQPGPELSVVSLGDLDTYLLHGDRALTGTVLASAKESIYQLNMARFDPPTGLASLYGLQQRSLNSIAELGLPTVRSPSALLALSNLRVLS